MSLKHDNANLFSRFEAVARANPQRTMLIEPAGRHWSYQDMLDESARAANALVALGLRPGDRLSVQVHKSIANLWLYLGALRAGVVYHPLNTSYTLEEVRFFIGDAGPAAMICDPARTEPYGDLAALQGVTHLMSLDAAGEGTWSLRTAEAEPVFATVSRRGDDLAVLLYSSGTTGRPKGIMLSHDNLVANVDALVPCWGFSEDDVLLHALPIYHAHGLFVAVHCALISGASMAWLPDFEPGAVMAMLSRITVMMGVPTYYTRLLANPRFDKSCCTNVRLFISGSAPLQESTFLDFEARSGHRILERYGMTETGMNTSNPLRGQRKPGSVGPPLPGTEVRVVDDQGGVLPPGDIGEIEIRGRNVFAGYWQLPEKTAADIGGDGWFRSGDQGRFDAEGYLTIVGRSKDMVISGGLNVYPREVEMVLDTLDGVVESAVFGVPHPDFGEAVVAVVVASSDGLDESSMRTQLARSLAGFKVPKRIQSVAALPRNTMGKVQKNRLRAEWPWPF